MTKPAQTDDNSLQTNSSAVFVDENVQTTEITQQNIHIQTDSIKGDTKNHVVQTNKTECVESETQTEKLVNINFLF